MSTWTDIKSVEDGKRSQMMRRTARILPALLCLSFLVGAAPALAHHISGKVKCDKDNDGKFDSEDTALSGIVVRATSLDFNPGQIFTDTTNSSGFYEIDLPARTDRYLVELINLPAGFTVVLPTPGGTYTVQIVTNTSQDHKDGADFLVQGCKPTTTTTTKTTTTKTTSTTTSSTSTSSSTSSSSTSSTSSSTTTSTTSSTSTSTSTSSTTTTSSSTTSTTSPLGHFQCYELKPASLPTTVVTSDDRFAPPVQTLTLRYPHRLCAPADKNGEGMGDPNQHLVGYETLRTQFTRRTETIANQFGTLGIDLTRRDVLMVPGAKGLNGPVPPLPDPTIDHFQCYRAKTARGWKFNKVTVSVVDQFETISVTLTRPYRLCVPTNKNNEDPTAPDHPTELLCYRTTSSPSFGDLDVHINTQFGPDIVQLIHRRELCVPSTVVTD